MHWMTEDRWYEISYADFAYIFGYEKEDYNPEKIHLWNPIDVKEMSFMYPRGEVVHAGTITNMYTFYSHISSYARDLLARMRDGAPPFSVIDYIWEEIKSISMNPLKTCAFAPYLMFMIEEVNKIEFPKDLSIQYHQKNQ
ncbi:hypothetical protein QOZ80_7AG0575730 [Eleusine coracana subsp. coracana]|nr:hypothetical protein QOZ80_7AG0575730 [Eleusine coracana subsp. coracana]